MTISIHALLAESDVNDAINGCNPDFISIHALLAESDVAPLLATGGPRYFYPRSPCGERLHYDNYNLHCVEISIHALLAESDSGGHISKARSEHFYPRSPCGERPGKSNKLAGLKLVFLSTLSLRRAT